MKKNLFILVASIAAIVLTGCKGGDNPEPSQNSIKLAYSAREIAIGDEIMADYTVTPADAKVTFTSSDPEVASVTSFGRINGLQAGATQIVVEAEGVGKDSMVIYVCEASELFTLGGFTLWDLDDASTTSDFRDSVEFSDGTKAVCKLCPGEWHVWDSNLSYDDAKGSISGAGYVIILENVPTYIIDDNNYEGGKYNGYYVGSRSLVISEDATGDSAYMVKPGAIIDANLWADLLDGIADSTAQISDAINDQAMHYIDYTNQEMYSWQAFVGEGIIKGNHAEVQYKQTIDWLGGIYGLAYDTIQNELGEDSIAIRRPVEIIKESIYYELWEDAEESEEEQAEAKAIKRFTAHKQNLPVSTKVKTLNRFYIAK